MRQLRRRNKSNEKYLKREVNRPSTTRIFFVVAPKIRLKSIGWFRFCAGQWSRDHRKAIKAGFEVPEALPSAAIPSVPATPEVPTAFESMKPSYSHLRVVNSSDS